MNRGVCAVFFLLVSGVLLFSGCNTNRYDGPYVVVRFYVETSPQYPARHSQPITMPESGATFNVDPRVQFLESDIRFVQIFDAELGPAVAFYFEPDAARDLRFFSLNNQGKRLVMMANGIPYGAKTINRVIDNGIVSMYLEYPDDRLLELADWIIKTSEEARRQM